jgi:DNA-binding CsgD family transcriptional regulator
MMTAGGRSGRLVEMLLERDGALAAIDRVLGQARDGAGCGVWLEGVPGVGKSSLVRRSIGRAAEQGLLVLEARAIDHMQGFPYGLAWSLLWNDLPTPAAYQHGLHTDGSGQPLAVDVGPAGELAVLHRLAGAVTDLASTRPVLLAVDDAHWSDLPSLRWLLYLTQRIDRLPVAIVAAARMHEPSMPGPLLRQLAAQPAFTRVTVHPLSPAAVSSVVLARLPAASGELCRDCQRLTDGNPFLLDLLLTSMIVAGRTSDAAAHAWMQTAATEAVSDDVSVRIGRLGPLAAGVVDAVTILGDGANVGEVAGLCGSDVDSVLAAVEALAAVDVLAPELPPSFAHPLLRAAVEHGMPAARSARLHRAAAALLDRRGVAVERVAAHLLEAVPTADVWVVSRLRAAAKRSLTGGAPAAAVDLLRRAIDEPPAIEDRVDVQVELAEAEIAAGEPAALERMQQALELVDDDTARADLLHRHGWMLYRAGRFDDAFTAFDAGRRIPTSEDTDVQARLAMAHLAVGALTGRCDVDAIDRCLAETVLANPAAGAARRELLVQSAVAEVFAARDHERACRLAHQALGDGAMLREDGLTFAYSVAVSVLFWCDALHDALEELARAVDHVGARADLSLFGYVLFGRAQPRYWCGDVAGAAADAGSSVDLWAGGWHERLPVARYWLSMALVELDDLVTAELSLPDPDTSDTGPEPFGHAARGHIALARGDVDAARDALRVCETLSEGLPFLGNPATYPWRADAAIAAKLAGDEDDARRLAEEDLRLASSFGAARPLGVALRTAALVAEDEDRAGLLERAVDVLDRSPALLERCRTLVEFGSELRRRGRRSDARDPLYRGLDLARRSGLVRLERRAVDELRATGARPRRRDVTGPGALTPTETRVAELAAHGHSNREIAQLLFVTRKTVEWHLSHAYTKLGIDGRLQLAMALDARQAERAR